MLNRGDKMNLKYHAIIDHQEIDSSNSLISLRKRTNEYIITHHWENVYIVKGVRNPLIVWEYDSFSEKWQNNQNRYNELFNTPIVWLNNLPNTTKG